MKITAGFGIKADYNPVSMKLTTPITCISLIALAASPASALLIESFETDSSYGGDSALWSSCGTTGFSAALSTTGATDGSYSLAATVPTSWANGVKTGSSTTDLGSLVFPVVLGTNTKLAMDVTVSSDFTASGDIFVAMQGNGDNSVSLAWSQQGVSVNPGEATTISFDMTDFPVLQSDNSYLNTDISTTLQGCGWWYEFILIYNFTEVGTVYIDNIRCYGPILWVATGLNSDTWYGDVYAAESTEEGWIYAYDQDQWQYAVGTTDGMFTWDEDLGWTWVLDDYYPYVYNYDDDIWLYFAGVVDSVRWYYAYGAESGYWTTDADVTVDAYAE